MTSQLNARFFGNLIAVFAVLSVADLFLTWKLIELQQNTVLESNPVAARILKEFGWTGLSIFKGCMVLLIASAAVVVVRRCPRTGELLMVFGCGAQAAIVITSIFLCTHTEVVEPLASTGRNTVSPPPLPPEAMAILVQASVAEELKLSPEHVEFVDELVKLRRELAIATRRGVLSDLGDRYGTVQSRELLLVSELSRTQLTRLQQLTWQHRGPVALGDEDVISTLALSPEQIDSVQSILNRVQETEALRKGRRPISAGREADDELTRCRDELLAVLSPAQRNQWERMLGAPFAFDPPANSLTIADAD